MDGVAVFDAVEAADGDAAGVGILGINAENVALDPMGDHWCCSAVGRGFLAGGMMLARRFFRARSTTIAVIDGRLVGFELIKSDLALAHAVAMAIKAISLQDGPDLGAKFNRAGTFRGGSAKQKHSHTEDGHSRGAESWIGPEVHNSLWHTHL